MTKESITVKGMSCAHCEGRVNGAVEALAGVKSCKASAKKARAEVKFDESTVTLDGIRAAITEAGYEVE